MQVTKTVEETRKQIKAWKKEGKTIGLVPTMGFPVSYTHLTLPTICSV